jgi:hypothetical protein
MGGIPSQFEFLERLNDHPQVHFVIPIPSASEAPRRKGNVVFLPHRSEFYHPDLLNASNVVVGKVGYSTLAEAYHAGVPCGYVRRARFREAPVLVDFMRAHLQGGEISAARFEEGSWLADLTEILGWRRVERGEPNGAAQIAEFVSALINA